MNSKPVFALVALLFVTLLAFQNCGSFAAVQGIATNGSSLGADDSSYIDGLPAGISQSGSIFSRDPATSAGNYTLPYTTDLSTLTTPTTVMHLKSGSFLSDGFADFSADDAFPNVFADPKSALAYVPSDSRFDQVNAYYRVDKLIADLSGQNLFPAPYPALKVNSHCTASGAKDNAFYSFTEHTLCLGYTDISSQRIWSAQDADVVVHEFGHSLNHKYTPDDTWASTSDNGAMDEGFADLWAFRQNHDHRIAMWFGRAIYVASGYTFYNSSVFPGLRDLDRVKSYPADFQFEVHADSEFISAVVKEIETNSGMSSAKMAKFEKRLIESMQYGHGFADVAKAMQDEGPALGASLSVVNAALKARGLLRKDLASEVTIDNTKPFYIIDNHKYPDYQVNGNCNGALDAGETVLVYPNIRNNGLLKGGVRVSLTTTDSSITILSGGDVGYFPRAPANATFLAGELSTTASTSTTYQSKLLGGSFAIKANRATTAAQVTVTISTMNTVDSVAQSISYPMTIPIGSVANISGSCSGSGETSVWP